MTGLRHLGIQQQILRLAVAATAALLAVFVTVSLVLNSVLAEIEQHEVHDHQLRTRLFLQRQVEGRNAIISEFAFWDDTWEYVDDPASTRSQEFLTANFTEWLPARYGVRLVRLWSPGRAPVATWADPAFLHLRERLSYPGFFERIDRERLFGGFLERDGILLMVNAAAIMHGGGDASLAGPTNGYLAVSQPVGGELVEQAALALQEVVTFHPPPPGPLPDSGLTVRVAGGDSLSSSFILTGLDGRPAARVEMRWSRAFLARLRTQTLVIYGATAVVGLAVLLLLLRAGSRLVVRPLERIGEELRRMRDGGRLEPLPQVSHSRDWDLFVSSFNGTVDALRQSEEQYRLLFDRAADPMFLLDAEAETVLDCNPAAERITGRTRQELRGRALAAVLPLEAAQQGRTDTYRLRRADGGALTVSIATSRLEMGADRRVLMALRDLTERDLLEAQLRNAQKMEAVGLLAGGVAHDFNNLLGTVLMATSSLRDEIGSGSPAQESVGAIEHAARRAAELTQGLLSFARPGVRESVPLSVNEVVGTVVRLCGRTFDRAIDIELDLVPVLPSVTGDPGQLEQALLNLCINARDAMPAGGTLRLATRRRQLDEDGARRIDGCRPGPYVVIEISDTGVGLTDEARDHIFEPFFTTKGRGKGTGLGLSVVYGIVRSHRGGIAVASRAGTGTTFELFLPASSAPAPVRPPVEVQQPPRGDECILVVDDEQALRAAVRRTLERLGYSVLEAADGRAAIEVLSAAADRVDLVLLDMIMPEMGGAEAFRLMRQLCPGLPVVVSSGYALEDDRLSLLDEGISGYLRKPFDMMDLARTVRAAIDQLKPAGAG